MPTLTRTEREDLGIAVPSPLGALAATPSIRIIAEGDSWFAYPRKFLLAGAPANLVHHLADDRQLDIDNRSENGDEAVGMVSGDAKLNFLGRLRKSTYDIMLFSGGGNDIVGEFDFPYFLRPKGSGGSGTDLVIEDRFERRLAQILAAYCDLVELSQDAVFPRKLPILSHTYDIAAPSDVGAEFFGITFSKAWMKRFMDAKGIVDRNEQIEIVRSMLGRFADRLLTLPVKYPGVFHVVPTQGTLGPDEWLNEIHPTSAGFGRIAQLMRPKIYELVGRTPISPQLDVGADTRSLDARVAALEAQVSHMCGGPQAPAIVRAENLGSGMNPRELPKYHRDRLVYRLHADVHVKNQALGMAAMDVEPASPTGNPLPISHVDPFAKGFRLPARRDRRQALKRGPMMAGTLDVPTEMPADLAGATETMIKLSCERARDDVARALRSDPRVAEVSKVPMRFEAANRAPKPNARKAPSRNAPPSATAQEAWSSPWNYSRLGWQTRTQAAQVRVAVLDTGCDVGHPDLANAGVTIRVPKGSMSLASSIDISGHGTHVTGVLCAAREILEGQVEGLIGPTVSSYKIFDDTPELDESIFRFVFTVDPVLYRWALAECLDEDIDVMNLSIGGYAEPDSNERVLFEELTDAGVVVVAAAGNGGTSAPCYPAALPSVVAVGALTRTDDIASFSNSGTHLTVCAPGHDVFSTLPTYPGEKGFYAIPDGHGGFVKGAGIPRGVRYGSLSGTSMAAPHVAAACAAIVAQAGARPGFHAILAKLKTLVSAVPGMGGKPFHPHYGFGLIQWP